MLQKEIRQTARQGMRCPVSDKGEKIECDDCGKEDCLIFTTVTGKPKNYKLKFK